VGRQFRTRVLTVVPDCYLGFPRPTFDGELREFARQPISFMNTACTHPYPVRRRSPVVRGTPVSSLPNAIMNHRVRQWLWGDRIPHARFHRPTRIYSSGKAQAGIPMELGPLPRRCTGSCASVNVRFPSVRSSCTTAPCLSPPTWFSGDALRYRIGKVPFSRTRFAHVGRVGVTWNTGDPSRVLRVVIYMWLPCSSQDLLTQTPLIVCGTSTVGDMLRWILLASGPYFIVAAPKAFGLPGASPLRWPSFYIQHQLLTSVFRGYTWLYRTILLDTRVMSWLHQHADTDPPPVRFSNTSLPICLG
jgi:hypothetical protein